MTPPMCPGCAERDQEILRLRQLLEETRRQSKRQVHPFAKDKDGQAPAKPKSAGRPKGHEAAVRPVPTPDQVDRVVDVECRACPDCGSQLVDPGTVVQYQTDLPPIVPIVTQFNIETGYCVCCRQAFQGRHPEQTSDAKGVAANTIGPVALTMAAELKHRLGVPYRKICDFFQTYCGLKICMATLVRAEQRLAHLAKPTYDLLIDALRRSGVVHADETGWKVGRLNAWLWVFSNDQTTVYTIRTGKGSRGHTVPGDILGDAFDGFLIVDGFKAYEVLEYAKGQCNGHLLRRGKELNDTLSSHEARRVRKLVKLIQQAIDLAQRRDQLTPAGYARRVQSLENRLDRWLDRVPAKASADLARLDKHIRKHRGEWFVFLHEPTVPPTNNHAERMLRPAVISRKIGGCNQTLAGALTHSILASLMATCHQQGQKFLDLARKLWRAGQPRAVRLLTRRPA